MSTADYGLPSPLNEILHVALIFGLLVGLIGTGWLCEKSPTFYTALKIALLLLWGLVAVIMPLFVILAIQLPDGRYGQAATSALLAGVVMVAPWWLIGWPALRENLRQILQ